MDWCSRRDEIQARFFRVGLFTFLTIHYDLTTGFLVWEFTFKDLGMCHTVSGKSLVVVTDSLVFSVDGVRCTSEQEALESVFGGKYQQFLSEMYAELGVECPTEWSGPR
jgi:hypothetical protein